jgi:segregation and condensation protein B
VEEERLKAILESLLFAAGEPITLAQMVSAIETVARDDIRRALGEMAVAYAEAGRGLILEEVAGGYQLRTRREHAAYVRRLLAARPPRLSRPLMETVAIVAYRQPITRPEIEQLRGVDCGGVIDTLLERQLIKIAGRKEAPGRPIVYATTPEFLELFGLKDLSNLPDLEEFREIELPRDDAPVIDADAASAAEEPRISSVPADSADDSRNDAAAEAEPSAASEATPARGDADEPSAQDSEKSD